MNQLRKQIPIISAIPHLNAQQYRQLINKSDKHLLHCLTYIIENSANGKLRLKPKLIKRLKKYRAKINKLRNVKLPLKQRRKQLANQSGHGLISLLLPAVISGIIGLIRGRRK